MTLPHGSSAEVIDRLQQQIRDKLTAFNPGPRPYALLDFPDHSNVGDSAIWIGEVLYCEQTFQKRPSYVCRVDDVDWAKLARAVPDGPIFIHGGGNFGDIWPVHQQFREEVLSRFPGRPVIQLPQTIHYDDPARAAQTAEIIARHGAFTLLVRDHDSLAFAQERFDCAVHLVPDMAFMIGGIGRDSPPLVDRLFVLRADKERLAIDDRTNSGEGSQKVTDWIWDDPYLRAKSALRSLRSLVAGHDPQRRRYDKFRYLAQARVQRGIRLLSQGRTVTTDRLHVHILSTLMDIDHVLWDNRYGKIRRFADTWDTRWPGVSVSSVDQAAVKPA